MKNLGSLFALFFIVLIALLIIVGIKSDQMNAKYEQRADRILIGDTFRVAHYDLLYADSTSVRARHITSLTSDVWVLGREGDHFLVEGRLLGTPQRLFLLKSRDAGRYAIERDREVARNQVREEAGELLRSRINQR